MTTNFEIVDNYAVAQDGVLFDLHNNFDLHNFQYHAETREFIIHWTKSTGARANKEVANELTFIHKHVLFLMINDSRGGRTDDPKTLGELSFFPSTERHINDCLKPQSQPASDDDILYCFENGSLIRVGCEAIVLTCIL